jgi:AraC-like DNA-binding protein
MASLAADIEYCWTIGAQKAFVSPAVTRSPGKDTVDLVIPIKGHFCESAETHLFGTGQPGAYLVGPLSQPASIASTGHCTALGLRFRPGRIQQFFQFAAHEIRDRCLPVDAIDQGLSRAFADRVISDGLERGIIALQRALLEHRSDEVESATVTRAVALIDAHHGNLSVDAMADRMHTSVRNLERLFREAVGLSPKQVCRISRARRAANILLSQDARATDVVHACGYFDQAHFIREFRAVVGVAPSVFRKEREQPCSPG